MENGLIDALRATAAGRPDLPAIRLDRTVGYANLSGAVDRLAVELRESGAGPGGVVATIMPNSAEFVACYYAAQLAGSLIVPLSTTLARPVLEQRLLECGPAVVMLPPDPPRPVVEAVATSGASVLTVRGDIFSGFSGVRPTGRPRDVIDGCPGTVATLAYTSAGSEGTAAAELTHGGLAGAASTLASTVLRLTPGDVVLSTFPTLSTLGQTCGINATVAAGASLSIPSRFDPDEILRVIAAQRVSVLAIFPALLPAVLREARRGKTDVGSLRTILAAGGATVPIRMREPLEATFGCEILECFGPTETAALACSTMPDDVHRPGSVGRAVEGVEVRVHVGGDHDAPPGVSGELLVRGPHTMLGYRGDPEATKLALRDGWLHTGNEARMDTEGYVYLLDGGWIGRAKGPRVGRPGPLRRAWRRLGPAAGDSAR